MKYATLLLSLGLFGCATNDKVTCEDYLATVKEPVLLQPSTDLAKPSMLPLALAEVGTCQLNDTDMTIVKLRTDVVRLELLGQHCIEMLQHGSDLVRLTEQEMQACNMTLILYQCLGLPGGMQPAPAPEDFENEF